MKRAGVLILVLVGVACGRADSGSSADTPFGQPSSSSSGGSRSITGPCDPANAADIEVLDNNLAAYPPYAVAGCNVVYVAKSGDLIERNLASKEEAILANVTNRPRRPSMSTEIIAWEMVDDSGRSVIAIWPAPNGDDTARSVIVLDKDFTFAGEPRVSGNTVSFTAWNGPGEASDSDVWIWDAEKGARKVIGGAAQQRFSDVSDAYVAATDFSEDPDGRYDGDGTDLADIVVFDRATGVITKRPAPAKQAFPMLAGGDLVAYLHWNEVHPEPKLQAYELRAGRIGDDVANDRKLADVTYVTNVPVRPAANGGTIEWIANPDGTTVLWRAAADGSSAPVSVGGLDGLRLYAPAPSIGFTVLAAEANDGTTTAPRLRVVNR